MTDEKKGQISEWFKTLTFGDALKVITLIITASIGLIKFGTIINTSTLYVTSIRSDITEIKNKVSMIDANYQSLDSHITISTQRICDSLYSIRVNENYHFNKIIKLHF